MGSVKTENIFPSPVNTSDLERKEEKFESNLQKKVSSATRETLKSSKDYSIEDKKIKNTSHIKENISPQNKVNKIKADTLIKDHSIATEDKNSIKDEQKTIKLNFKRETKELEDLSESGDITKFISYIRSKTTVGSKIKTNINWNETCKTLNDVLEVKVSQIIKNEFKMELGDFLVLSNKLSKIDNEIQTISNEIENIYYELDINKDLKTKQKKQFKSLLQKLDQKLIEKSELLKKADNKVKIPEPTRIKIKNGSDINQFKIQINAKKTGFSKIDSKLKKMKSDISNTTEMLSKANFYNDTKKNEYVVKTREKIRALDHKVQEFLINRIEALKKTGMEDKEINNSLAKIPDAQVKDCFNKHCQVRELNMELELAEIQPQIELRKEFVQRHVDAEQYDTLFYKEFEDLKNQPEKLRSEANEIEDNLETSFSKTIKSCVNQINELEQRRKTELRKEEQKTS